MTTTDKLSRSIGGLAGMALIPIILLQEFLPLVIAGQLFSGTLDARDLLRYYNHPSLAWIYWYSGLSVTLLFPLFAISHNQTLNNTNRFNHSTHNDGPRQCWQNVKTSQHWANRIPHAGSEATRQHTPR